MNKLHLFGIGLFMVVIVNILSFILGFIFGFLSVFNNLLAFIVFIVLWLSTIIFIGKAAVWAVKKYEKD